MSEVEHSRGRRFPRVHLAKAASEVTPVLGAQVVWPNLETSQVLDLSYKGFAVNRPGLFACTLQMPVELGVQLGQNHAFAVRARVVWISLDRVGLEVPALDAKAHLAMGAFLDAQLIGAGLKLVPRTFVSGKETFHSWFQGPANTNVFVWTSVDQRVERVSVSLDGAVVDFQRGHALRAITPIEQRALLVLSQMDKTPASMEEFLRSMGPHVGV